MHRKTNCILALALIFSLGVASQLHLLGFVPNANAQAAQEPTSSTKVYITPSNITDLARPIGSHVVVSVNVSDAPSFNAFAVIIHYNNASLQATGLDYSGTVLGTDAKVVVYCYDGIATPPLVCDPQFARFGQIALSLTSQSGFTGNITRSKTLFQIKFDVVAKGLSQIHIYSATLGLGIVSKDPLFGRVFNTFDGFFSNVPCGGGLACQPPTVRVSFQPNPVPKDSVVTFNLTVIELNLGAKVLSERWDWGDGTQADVQTNSSALPIGKPITHQFLSSRFGLATQCVNNGLCLVGLTVLDSGGVSWEITLRVQVLTLNIVLSVGNPDIKPQFHVFPGTPVQINATLRNPGNIAENATLTIRLENTKTLNSKYFPELAASGGTVSLSTTLDTSELAPRAYAIVASITNTSSAQPIDGKTIHSLNSTSQPVATSYVLIVSPLITGALSLSILQTAGLGVLILAAVVIVLARFLKKPSYLEPL